MTLSCDRRNPGAAPPDLGLLTDLFSAGIGLVGVYRRGFISPA
jgi:hypothetical protein